MTNLETMEKGLNYTKQAWMDAYYPNVTAGITTEVELENDALAYSANALYQTVMAPNGMCNNYTRKDNLRFDMAALGKDAIKNELLKNIVNVATYQIVYDTRAGNELGTMIRAGMTGEQIAVIICNAMSRDGVEKGYEMLKDPSILSSACNTFAYYKGNEKRKETMYNIGTTNPAAIQMNEELDVYYARYGDRPNQLSGDTSGLDSYGYEPSGGFSR
jgi:hypothetical protein